MNHSKQAITVIEVSIVGAVAAALMICILWDGIGRNAAKTTILMRVIENGQEIQKAALSASLDSAQSEDGDRGFPGDMTTPPSTVIEYVERLKEEGYLSSEEVLEIYPHTDVPGVKISAKDVAFGMGLVSRSTPDLVPFLCSKNFNPTTQRFDSSLLPRFDNSFFVIQKTGDAGLYRASQAKKKKSADETIYSTVRQQVAGGPTPFIWGIDPASLWPPVRWEAN